MEGQIEQIGLCLLTMGETRISDNSGTKSNIIFYLPTAAKVAFMSYLLFILLLFFPLFFWQSTHKEMNHGDYDKKSDKNLSVDPALGQQHSHAPVGLVKFLSIDWEFPLHSVIFGRHIFWGNFPWISAIIIKADSMTMALSGKCQFGWLYWLMNCQGREWVGRFRGYVHIVHSWFVGKWEILVILVGN